MKKTLIALSFVCAGALAFADKEQFNSSWFSGIGTGATSIEALGASNGTWSGLTADNASVADGALVLDLDDGVAEATFAVTDTASAKAPGTLPAQGIVVRGVFTPIAADDLLTGKVMAEKGAKVGFAIVNMGGEADAYKYYAWVGGGSEAETESTSAINDWVALGDATDVTVAKTIVIDLEYEATTVSAAFAVGAVDLADLEKAIPLTGDEGVALTGSALSKALEDKVIASVSCTGSGTLKELQGLYQYAVAEVNGTPYGTVEEAVGAVQLTGATVKLVRAAEGVVTVAGGVTIDPNGKGAPTVTVDEKSDNSKEVYTDETTHIVTVQTKTSILNDIKFTVGSGAAATQKGLMKNEAKFRDFLNKHCGTEYRQANTTAEAIQNALAEVDSTSKRALWQSYALGVEPDATLKLTQVAKDDAEDGITLKFPGTPSGDFTIKYTVTDGTADGTMTVTDAPVKVPLKTGHYAVKISFE